MVTASNTNAPRNLEGIITSMARTRIGASMEQPAMIGTRSRPATNSGYRTSHLTNVFETGLSSPSMVSSCSSSLHGLSPFSHSSTFRPSERASSAASRPRIDAVTVIRPNSRFGTSFLNSTSSTNNNGSSVVGRTSKSLGSVLSPRQEANQRNSSVNNAKTYPYRTMGLSQPRAMLLDIRQNLRPIKRHTVTDYKPTSITSPSSSTRLMFTAAAISSNNTAVFTPLALFTNAQIRTATSMPSSAISPPISKCISPRSMSRSSSTITSPITSPISSSINVRPIPKSERPWRQKLADSQRLREAKAERGDSSVHYHAPSLLEQSYETNARLLAARTARRASIEYQQQQKQQNNEQKLEKEIAALKCYVSEPGALDKNATVAKFRQKMSEHQLIPPSLIAPSAASTTATTLAAAFNCASSLLSRMPSLNRRATTTVSNDTLKDAAAAKETAASNGKQRPRSMVETPLGARRLSTVCEAMANEKQCEMGAVTALSTSPQSTSDKNKKEIKIAKNKESPKMPKKKIVGAGTARMAPAQPGGKSSQQQNSSTIVGNSGVTKKATSSPSGTDLKTALGKSAEKNEQKKRSMPLLRRKKKDDLEQQQNGNDGPKSAKNIATDTEKQQTATEKKQTNGKARQKDDEKRYNAVVQFKPQSTLLRRKPSDENDDSREVESKKTAAPVTARKRAQEKTTSPSLTSSEGKPVPGTWERGTGTPRQRERFISQNRHLIRRSASESAACTQPVRALARVCSVRMLAVPSKKGDAKFDGGFCKRQLAQNQNAAISMKAKGSPTASVLKMIKSIASPKPKQRICAVAVVDKQFTNKRTFRLGIRKTLLLKSVPQKLCAQLHCRSAQLKIINIPFNIVRREPGSTATVCILLADWERVVSERIREHQQQQQQQHLASAKKKKGMLETIPFAFGQNEVVADNKNDVKVVLPQEGGGQQQRSSGRRAPLQISESNQLKFHSPIAPTDSANLITSAVASIADSAAALAADSTLERGKISQQRRVPRPPAFLQKVPPPKIQLQPVPSAAQKQQLAQEQAPATTTRGDIISEAAPLILPDQSVLEQFVQRKRNALERLHSEVDDGELSTPQATHQPSPAAANLTAPGAPFPQFKSSATAHIVNAVSLPGSKRNSQMLATGMAPANAAADRLLPHSLTNSFHAALQTTAADLRALQQQPIVQQHQLSRPQHELTRATLSTQAFEKPKSLFEEQMQRQAVHLLKQKAARQSLYELPSTAAPTATGIIRRKSTTVATPEHSTVMQTIIPHPQRQHQQQEERYIACVPLNGRQSTTSIDVTMLDADQRAFGQHASQYRNQQQQNKFKEAIDYLDHIFEDFQRDAAPTADNKRAQQAQQQTKVATPKMPLLHQMPKKTQQQQQQQSDIEPIQATFRPAGQVRSAKEAFEKAAAALASEKRAAVKLKKQISAPAQPTFGCLNQQQIRPTPAAVTNSNRRSQQRQPQFEQFAQTSAGGSDDVDIAETIVLPGKNTSDRLDFTRHWLASGHIRTWADGGVQSKRDGAGSGVEQLLDGSGRKPGETAHGSDEYNGYDDSDEHSLGSCSAEVAAINAANQRMVMRQQKIQQQQGQKKQGQGQKQQSAAYEAMAKKKEKGTSNGGCAPIRQLGQQKGAPQPQQMGALRHKQQPPPLITATAATTSTNSTGSNPPPPQIVSGMTVATNNSSSSKYSCGNNGQQQPAAPAAIRPQPYRPQPQIGFFPPGLATSEQMHKVASSEQLRLKTSQERACSQDYQSMGSSVHSQDGFRPSAVCLSTHSLQRIGGGAFHSYTPIMMPTQQQPDHHHHQQQQYHLKGSIQSLPDSALVGQTGLSANYMFGMASQQQQPINSHGKKFDTLGRTENHNRQQRLAVPSVQQQPQSLAAAPRQIAGSSVTNEHTLAIDALVAELAENTDTAITSAEKRRSFPTMQTEVGRTNVIKQQQQQQQQPSLREQQRGNEHVSTTNTGMNNANSRPLEELNEVLLAERAKRVALVATAQRKQSTNSAGGSKPFETINQEKLNPSRVDAMARIFDHQSRPAGSFATALSSRETSNDNGSHQHTWTRRTGGTSDRIPSTNRITSSTTATTTQHGNSSQLSQHRQNGNTSAHGGTNCCPMMGAQLMSPQRQPKNISNSSRFVAITSNSNNSASSVYPKGAASMMDSAADLDEPTMPDDCNYDNIQNAHQRPRPLPGCFIDDGSSSLSSHGAVLPPSLSKSAGGRIGQLIRKLGSVGTDKPPISAASMISLNRVSNEPLSDGRNGGGGNNSCGLSKSNSLSGDPWRCQVLAQQNDSSKKMTTEEKPQHNGIGNRLKQTIFGGMVRRRVPT